ncbi:glycosyltransferase family 4 protein [Desulfofundulus thermosubterraneus]|nr:glycosyltransferase family 4 protein [Desulfofundulus thermosubterraneus]
MKISGGHTEKGVEVGNCYDKYGSRNPIKSLAKVSAASLNGKINSMKSPVSKNKKKLRVIFITRKWPPAVGGMETYSVELVNELKQHTDLLVKSLPGRSDGQPPSILALFRFFLSATALIAIGRRVDVVHIGDLVLWPLALIARIFQPHARIIATAYGLDIVYGLRKGLLPRIYRLYLAVCVRFCRHFLRIIAISHATAALCRGAGFSDVVVVPLGVRSVPVGEVMDVNPDRYVLFVGRLVRRKGVSWFIRNVLPRLDQDITLKIAGTCWDRTEWEAITSDPRVEFLGVVSNKDLVHLRRKALVVIMPNVDTGGLDFEGFGLTALEAAADGGVLLVSGIDGIVDAVVDGRTGFLLPPGNADAWVKKITEIAGWSVEQRRAFIAVAHETVIRDFSWERVARETLAAYEAHAGEKK